MNKLLPLLFTSLLALPAFADMVHISADRDNTLIEDADGARSNGIGPAFFAGRTNQSMFSVRRALVRFDVAAALPEDAIIDRVFLSLYQDSSNVEPSDVSLHRVLADWGEGASFRRAAVVRPLNPATRRGCTRFTITTSGCSRAGIS